MKKHLIAAFTLIIILAGYSPAHSSSWSLPLGGTGEDRAFSVQQTSDGGYIVAGYTASFGGNNDAWVMKLNADGTVAWQKTYGGINIDYAFSVRQTSDGGYIVAGSWSFDAGEDAWVMKLNADGTVAWQNTYGGTNWDTAFAIQQTSDGGYIIAGCTAGDAWVMKLNADGTVAWQKAYGGSSDDQANAVQQTADGGYIVAGYTWSFGAGHSDAWVLKLNADGGIVWQKTYGGTSEDYANSVQQTSDGGYIVAGYTASFGTGGEDAWVLKLNADGGIVWQKTYGGTSPDRANSVQPTADGGYIIAGDTWSFGAGGYDAWVLKLNADGTVAWQKTYGGSSDDQANSIRQTADGGYIMAGYTTSFGEEGSDAWVLKLDLNGNILGCSNVAIAESTATAATTSVAPVSSGAVPAASSASVSQTAIAAVDSTAAATTNCSYDVSPAQWQKTYGGSGLDSANSVQQTSDGGYIVAGLTSSFGAGNDDAWVLKLNSDGGVEWQKTYGGTGYDEIYDIQQTSDGGYIAAGYSTSSGAGAYDAWVLKLNADGSVAWQKTYGGTAQDGAKFVQQTADGGYIVAGYTTPFGAGYLDVWMLKLNADGTVAWQKTYGGTGDDYANSVQQTADGGYIVAGNTDSLGAGSFDAWVLKLNADGTVAWQKTYGGTGYDSANSVQQTADGGYIVAGYTWSFGAGIVDAWVLKLNADGGITWQKTFGGTSLDYANSVQQTADGGYIVVGYTWAPGAGGFDAWVLKLNADGGIAWQKTYDGAGNDYANFIRQTADGGYIVSGTTYSSGAGDADAWVMKLDQNGGIAGCANIVASSTVTQNSAGTVSSSGATTTVSSATVSSSTATVSDTSVTPGSVCSASYIQYLLDAETTGQGSGSITSNPSGINCGASCLFPFTSDTSVTLTATPAAGSLFAGWVGGVCSGTGTCTVTMNADKTVTAQFNLDPVNGSCGSSNGGAFATAPTANLCGAGIASVVSGSGPWNWTCAGLNGGTTASCSAQKQQSAATDADVSAEVTCPAMGSTGAALNVGVRIHNKDCGQAYTFTKAKATLIGNAGGTLFGVGIYGPKQSTISASVAAPVCPAETTSSQVTVPVVTQIDAALAGKSAQVLIDAMTADGQVVASGECMVPIQ